MNRLGLHPGLGLGVETTGAAGMAGVTRDATSNIYVPANLAEWNTTLSVAGISSGPPSLLWRLQEASGNVADAIGSFTGTLVGTGATYQQTVAGWATKGIALADAATGTFVNSDAGLPDLSAASMMTIAYAIASAPGANEVLYRIGTTTSRILIRTSTVRTQGTSGVNSVTGAAVPTGSARPYVIRSNKTASTAMICTDQENLAPTFGAVTGKTIGISDGSFAVPATHLMLVSFFGAAAEMSDAQVKTLLQTLGWTILW